MQKHPKPEKCSQPRDMCAQNRTAKKCSNKMNRANRYAFLEVMCICAPATYLYNKCIYFIAHSIVPQPATSNENILRRYFGTGYTIYFFEPRLVYYYHKILQFVIQNFLLICSLRREREKGRAECGIAAAFATVLQICLSLTVSPLLCTSLCVQFYLIRIKMYAITRERNNVAQRQFRMQCTCAH